jgi:hypothetical protein
MVLYKCKKCSRTFDRKYVFDRHINRKTNCKIGGSKTNVKCDYYKCKNCDKSYSRKDTFQKHAKICKNIKIKIGTTKSYNKNSGKIINTNSNNVVINLIVFGKDGVENITQKDLAQILGSNNNIFESLISNVNLNPKKPQHHNIYYGDTKSSYGEVYENNTWIRKKIDEILETLINAKIDDLNEILNDMGDFLNKKSRGKIKNAIENMDYTRPGARKKLKTYLKPILYNHKEMIIKTRKLTKEQIEENFKKEQQEAEKEARKEEEALKNKNNVKKKN